MFQIRVEQRPESLTALVGILAGLGEGEVGLLQVLFQPARHPWYDNILEVAADPWDAAKSAFSDLPDLPRKARSKVEWPLFAVAMRLAASSRGLLERLQGSFLSQFESGENGFVEAGREYPVEPVVGRFTLTPGMLLNVRELFDLFIFPTRTQYPRGWNWPRLALLPPGGPLSRSWSRWVGTITEGKR